MSEVTRRVHKVSWSMWLSTRKGNLEQIKKVPKIQERKIEACQKQSEEKRKDKAGKYRKFVRVKSRKLLEGAVSKKEKGKST